MAEASIAATEVLCDLVRRVDACSRSGGAVQSAVEGIFEDLMLDVRVEQALDHHTKNSKGDAKASNTEGEVGGGAWAKTEAPLNRWLRELGKGSMDASVGAELAQALVALGRLWPGGPGSLVLGADEKLHGVQRQHIGWIDGLLGIPALRFIIPSCLTIPRTPLIYSPMACRLKPSPWTPATRLPSPSGDQPSFSLRSCAITDSQRPFPGSY